MLDIALQFLKDELNTYIHTRTSSNTEVVKMSRVVDDAGKYAIDEDTIGASIINIEEERAFKSQLPEYTTISGQHVVLEPELKLNLHVLFAANFKFYDVALKHISHVLTFFQLYPSFTPDEHPALDARIGKLILELQSLNYEQLNQIWAFIGGKQLPSVIYKARMIVIQDRAQKAVQPPVTAISTSIQSR
jgi:hypothetical protein